LYQYNPILDPDSIDATLCRIVVASPEKDNPIGKKILCK